MEIEHNFNFNDPIEVTVVFRAPDNTGKVKEYAGKGAYCWEDIKSVEEYAYSDDWDAYKGSKFWLGLHNEHTPKLVLGDYRSMYDYWRQFRNTYPLFRLEEDDKEGE